jgi:hypothetical protein
MIRKPQPPRDRELSPDMPDDIRRRDIRIDRPDSLPETPDDTGAGGVSPPEDGGVAQHPIHDEDLEDLDPADYEEQIDEAEDSGLLDRRKPQ